MELGVAPLDLFYKCVISAQTSPKCYTLIKCNKLINRPSGCSMTIFRDLHGGGDHESITE